MVPSSMLRGTETTRPTIGLHRLHGDIKVIQGIAGHQFALRLLRKLSLLEASTKFVGIKVGLFGHVHLCKEIPLLPTDRRFGCRVTDKDAVRLDWRGNVCHGYMGTMLRYYNYLGPNVTNIFMQDIGGKLRVPRSPAVLRQLAELPRRADLAGHIVVLFDDPRGGAPAARPTSPDVWDRGEPLW